MSPNSLSSQFKTRAGAVLLPSLVILSLLLAACGGTAPANSSATTKNTFIVVTSGPKGDFAQTMSPYSATPNDGVQGPMYETLLFFNRMDGSIKPWLASAYQLASDAKSVTFTIRQGVKWSDGQPFTSADVLFTLNLLKQYPAADTNSLWSVIKDVAAPDANTVKVDFLKPSSPILWYLGGQMYIVPQHAWANVGDPTKYVNSTPIGTGPYKLKSFTPQLITYTKNTQYWQPGKPAIQELRYPSYNSNTSAELVLSQGNLDWTGVFTPDINKTYVARDPAHNKYWFPPAKITMLYLNVAKAPFNKLAVRQAISDVLDRDQMSKIGESGYQPVAHPTALVLPANKSFLSTDYTSSAFSLDAAKAAQLLASAGFKKGSDGIYADASGKKISFKINVVTGWTDWVNDSQIMSTNLKALGMDVSVNAVSFNEYYADMQTGGFDATISWTNPGPTPYYLYNTLLNSANTAAIGKTAASNWERWSDPATDKLLAQYASTSDATVQQQALAGIQKIMVEQLPAIPLVAATDWNEYSTAHFTGWPTSDNPYAMPSPSDYPDNAVVLLNLKPVA